MVVKRSTNRVQLESDKYKASVRLTWDEKKKTWLLTMFEKKNSALDNTTDTGKTLSGNGNDTATPESTVISVGRGSENLRPSKKKGKLLYRFDGGAQTEQTPASVSVTTSRTNPGVSFGKGSGQSATKQEKRECSCKENNISSFFTSSRGFIVSRIGSGWLQSCS